MILRGDSSALALAGQTIVNEPGNIYDGGSPQAAVAGPGSSAASGISGIAEAKSVPPSGTPSGRPGSSSARR